MTYLPDLQNHHPQRANATRGRVVRSNHTQAQESRGEPPDPATREAGELPRSRDVVPASNDGAPHSPKFARPAAWLMTIRVIRHRSNRVCAKGPVTRSFTWHTGQRLIAPRRTEHHWSTSSIQRPVRPVPKVRAFRQEATSHESHKGKRHSSRRRSRLRATGTGNQEPRPAIAATAATSGGAMR